MMNFSRGIPAVLIPVLALFISCGKEQLPVARYYEYDRDLPLLDSVPLLMINAEQDEVIPPLMSRLLFKAAKNPREIIWHPSGHHDLPVDEVYPEGIQWFDKYLKDAS